MLSLASPVWHIQVGLLNLQRAVFLRQKSHLETRDMRGVVQNAVGHPNQV